MFANVFTIFLLLFRLNRVFYKLCQFVFKPSNLKMMKGFMKSTKNCILPNLPDLEYLTFVHNS